MFKPQQLLGNHRIQGRGEGDEYDGPFVTTEVGRLPF